MANIYDFNVIFVESTVWYLPTISESNLSVPESHHFASSSSPDNDQIVKNMRKLTTIIKTYGFTLLSKNIIIRMKALHRS